MTINFDDSNIVKIIADSISTKLISDDEFIRTIKDGIVDTVEKTFEKAIDEKMTSIMDSIINTDDIVKAIFERIVGTETISEKKELPGIVIKSIETNSSIADSLPDFGNGVDHNGYPNCRIVRLGERTKELKTEISSDIPSESVEEKIEEVIIEETSIIEEIGEVTFVEEIVNDPQPEESITTLETSSETEETTDESEDNVTQTKVEEVVDEDVTGKLAEVINKVLVNTTGNRYGSFVDFGIFYAIKYMETKNPFFEFSMSEVLGTVQGSVVSTKMTSFKLASVVPGRGRKKFLVVTEKFVDLLKKEYEVPFVSIDTGRENIEETTIPEESIQVESESSVEEKIEEPTIDTPIIDDYDETDNIDVGSISDTPDEPLNLTFEEKVEPLKTRKGMKGTKYLVRVIENDRNGDFVDKFYLKEYYDVKIGQIPSFVGRYSDEAYTFNDIYDAVDACAAFVIGRRSTEPYRDLPINVLKKRFYGQIIKVTPGMCHALFTLNGKELEKVIASVTSELVLSFPKCKLVDYGDKVFEVESVRNSHVTLDNGITVPIWKVKPIF